MRLAKRKKRAPSKLLSSEHQPTEGIEDADEEAGVGHEEEEEEKEGGDKEEAKQSRQASRKAKSREA